MIIFATSVVITLLGLIALIIVPRAPKDMKKTGTLLGSLFTFGGIAILVLSSVTIVPARTVGIPVSFGKPQQAVGNGMHWHAPWVYFEKLPATVQNDRYTGDNAVSVRLKNSSKARVEATIQWKMKEANASELYLNYKEFDSIRDNLVNREFVAALNVAMASFDPLNSVETSNEGTGSQLEGYADKVREELDRKVGSSIEVMSVTIPLIHFDESTQNRVDELQGEIARTRVALQKEKTARAEAEANKALESSLSDNVLTSKCLDIVESNGNSPLGCFPGSSQAIVDNRSK